MAGFNDNKTIMDMDFKPSNSPSSEPAGQAPQAPMITPTPPAPMEDPFKPDKPSAMPGGKPAKKSRKGLKIFFTVLLVLGLIAGVAYGVYYWQQRQIKQVTDQKAQLSQQVSDLQGQVKTLTTKNDDLTKAAATPTTDQLVITAVTDYCQAAVDPATGKALVYTQQTSGSAKKAVLYSADKKYATVTAVCATSANATTPSKVYYLKNSGKSWVVLYAASSPDATQTKLYAIPTDFN